MSEVKFFRLGEQEGVPATGLDGILMRAVIGETGMFNLIRIEADEVLPLHSHPHEQLGIILEGVQILEVEGVEHRLEKHDAYVLPGGVRHAGRGGPEGCLSIDFFIPVREDYRYAAAQQVEDKVLVEGA